MSLVVDTNGRSRPAPEELAGGQHRLGAFEVAGRERVNHGKDALAEISGSAWIRSAMPR